MPDQAVPVRTRRANVVASGCSLSSRSRATASWSYATRAISAVHRPSRSVKTAQAGLGSPSNGNPTLPTLTTRPRSTARTYGRWMCPYASVRARASSRAPARTAGGASGMMDSVVRRGAGAPGQARDPLVRVADDGRIRFLEQERHHLARAGPPEYEVPGVDHLIERAPGAYLLEHGRKRGQVPVDVREDRDPHRLPPSAHLPHPRKSRYHSDCLGPRSASAPLTRLQPGGATGRPLWSSGVLRYEAPSSARSGTPNAASRNRAMIRPVAPQITARPAA